MTVVAGEGLRARELPLNVFERRRFMIARRAADEDRAYEQDESGTKEEETESWTALAEPPDPMMSDRAADPTTGHRKRRLYLQDFVLCLKTCRW